MFHVFLCFIIVYGLSTSLPVHGSWDRKIPFYIAYKLSPPSPVQVLRLKKFKKYEEIRRELTIFPSSTDIPSNVKLSRMVNGDHPVLLYFSYILHISLYFPHISSFFQHI